jgi:hypothetical protein
MNAANSVITAKAALQNLEKEQKEQQRRVLQRAADGDAQGTARGESQVP